MKQQIKGNVMLIITAAIWGCAFVAQSLGMKYVGTFTFQAVRSILGSIVLIPVIFLMDSTNKKERRLKKANKDEKRELIKGGIVCGLAMCTAACFQQKGIEIDATASDSGFVTALYILIVPFLGIFLGKKIGFRVWVSVFIALAGLYIMTEKFTHFSVGLLLVFISSFVYAVHILLVGHYAPLVDGVRLSCIQFFITSLISGILMFIFEKPTLENIFAAKTEILYAGIMSCGVAYTLQILAQRYTNPVVSSMLMSLESVFALLFGMLLMPEENPFKWIKIVGGGLIFAAIILSEVPLKRTGEPNKNKAIALKN